MSVYFNGDEIIPIVLEKTNELNSLLKKKITKLPDNVFDGVTRIEDYIFYHCDVLNISNLNIPDTVTYIGQQSFRFVGNIGSISIPNTVTVIASYAFCYSNLHGRLLVPNSVRTIGQYAFQGNGEVTEAIIGEGLSNYSFNQTFHFAKNMNTQIACKKIVIMCTTSVPTMNNGSIFDGQEVDANVTQKYPIYVPNSMISNYISATNWTIFAGQNRILPWVDTNSSLSNIDTTLYQQACVIDEDYAEYVYDGSQWNEVA